MNPVSDFDDVNLQKSCGMVLATAGMVSCEYDDKL